MNSWQKASIKRNECYKKFRIWAETVISVQLNSAQFRAHKRWRERYAQNQEITKNIQKRESTNRKRRDVIHVMSLSRKQREQVISFDDMNDIFSWEELASCTD